MLSEHLEQIASLPCAKPTSNRSSIPIWRRESARKTVLETLNSARAKALFAEVEILADLCGIDDIDLGEQSVIPAEAVSGTLALQFRRGQWAARTDSILSKGVSARGTVTTGELILTPVSADSASKSSRAYFYAIDVSIGRGGAAREEGNLPRQL